MFDKLSFKCRGIGLDSIERCFVCGHETPHVTPNIAAFVESKGEGEKIVKYFYPGSARLDYREHEPEWIQVKIGACEDHKFCLEVLRKLTSDGDIHESNVFLASLGGRING